MAIFLLILGFIGFAHSATEFRVNIELTCVQPVYHPTTLVYVGCTKYTQTGRVEEYIGCFPEDSYVPTPYGDKLMSELEIGDTVFALDNGKVIETKVKAWLHRITHFDMNYTILTTDSGMLVASEMHNLAHFSENDIDYKYSHEFQVGDFLVGMNGTREKVHSINHTIMRGLYAPYTESGTLFVGYGRNSYLAHSFAHIRNPTLYKPLLDIVFYFYEMYDPDVHNLTDYTNYIHPIAGYAKATTVGKMLLDQNPVRDDALQVGLYRERRRTRTGYGSGGSRDTVADEDEFIMTWIVVNGGEFINAFTPPYGVFDGVSTTTTTLPS